MAKKINLESFLKSEDYKEKIPDLSFEQGLALLEDLVERVESGEVELDSVVRAYERAAELLKYLRSSLSGVETRIEEIQKELGANELE